MVDENDPGTETNVEIVHQGLSDNELLNITDFESAVQALGKPVTHVSDVLGNGFSVLEDKKYLLDIEIMIIKHEIHVSSQTDSYFSTLHVITPNGEKLIVNDGSTGIHLQCMDLNENLGKNAWLPLYVKRGLRMSEYDIPTDNGGTQRARTFYLNTSK